jgi:hypothetical protein
MTFAFCKYKKWAYHCGMENAQVKINIYRLDYLNPSSIGGFKGLSTLNNLSEVNDVQEVKGLHIYGEGFQNIINAMPKSYKFKISDISIQGVSFAAAYVEFNTFFTDGTTGDVNEAAYQRRDKVIKKLKSLGF